MSSSAPGASGASSSFLRLTRWDEVLTGRNTQALVELRNMQSTLANRTSPTSHQVDGSVHFGTPASILSTFGANEATLLRRLKAIGRIATSLSSFVNAEVGKLSLPYRFKIRSHARDFTFQENSRKRKSFDIGDLSAVRYGIHATFLMQVAWLLWLTSNTAQQSDEPDQILQSFFDLVRSRPGLDAALTDFDAALDAGGIEEGQRLMAAVMREMAKQESFDCGSTSILLTFSAIRALDKDLAFARPAEHSPFLSAYIWVIKAFSFAHSLFSFPTDSRSTRAVVSDYDSFRNEFLVFGPGLYPAETLFTELAYAQAASKGEEGEKVFGWSQDGTTVKHRSLAIGIVSFKTLILDSIQRAEAAILDIFAFVGFPVSSAISIKQLGDDTSRRTPGYSYLEHPTSKGQLQEPQNKFLTLVEQAILTAEDTIRKSQTDLLLSNGRDIDMALALMLYVATGHCPRVLDIVSLTRCNLASIVRALMVGADGIARLCFIPSKNAWRRAPATIRILSGRMSSLLLTVDSLIRPALDDIRLIQSGIAPSPLLLVTNVGAMIHPKSFRLAFQPLTKEHFGRAIYPSDFRQLTAAIVKRHFTPVQKADAGLGPAPSSPDAEARGGEEEEGEDDDEDDEDDPERDYVNISSALHEQAGHSVETALR